MNRTTKLLIAAIAVGLGVVIGAVMIVQSQSESLGEESIRAMVTDRYSGEIKTIETEGKQYIVHVEDEGFEYEITMSREDGSITAMDSHKIAAEESTGEGTEPQGASEAPGEEPAEESVEETTEEPTETSSEEPSSEEPAKESAVQVTEAEAKALALKEVGGQFVHVALNQEIHPVEYQVIQLVEDDDEGALVSVNAKSGEIVKVLWFSIDFEDITDIEAFARELQNYNKQYQDDYYIEFDDDNSTDNDDDTESETDDDSDD